MPEVLRAVSVRLLASMAVTLGCLLDRPAALAATPPGTSPYIIDVWETEQGLPENSATSMVQTPDGYLWFGTFNGLVRFDGIRLTVLDSSNTPQLPSAPIVNLHLDRLGRLWISTDQGLVIVKDGRWTRLGAASGWKGDYVRTFAEAANGDMYLSTFDRRYLHFHRDRFEVIPSPIDDPTVAAYPFVDEANQFWLLHPKFIGRWNGRAWESRPDAFGAPGLALVGSGLSRDGGLWVVSQRHLTKYRNGRALVDVPIPTPTAGFWSLFEDSTGVVWITSYRFGVYRYSPRDGWSHLTTATGLSYDAMRFTFEDREGNIWLGTSGGGLMRLKPRSFLTWGLAEGLSERVVKSIASSADGQIVLGTFGGGVVRLDGTPIVALENKAPAYVDVTLVDRLNRLWVGLFEGGFHRVDAATLGHGPPALLRTNDVHRPIYCLFEDSKGRVWVGGQRAIWINDSSGTREVPLGGATIRALAEDPLKGTVWAGTANAGLQRFAGDHLEAVPSAKDLSTAGISALMADPDGTLWIGTAENGLACLTHDRLVRLGEAQGVPAHGIGSIVDDLKGFVWLGTNKGIIRVPRADLADVVAGRRSSVRARVYDRADGLISTECPLGIQPSAMRDKDGRIWFATLKGVARVDPAVLRVNTDAPLVLIDEVRVDDRLVAGTVSTPFAWGTPAPAIAPAGSRRVEVHFTGISLTAPEKVRFKYRIDGLDTDWVEAGTRRVVYLQDLAPGTYAFHVKAANSDGVWNETGATLAITMQPFWWQTLTFKTTAALSAICLVGLLGWWGSRFALRRQLERQAHARALEQERGRLASVLDATSDCVAFADPEGRLLYLNPAGRRTLGFDPSTSLQDRTLTDLHPPGAAARLTGEAIPAAIRDGLWSGETTLLAQGGLDIPVSQVIAVHRSSDGKVQFLSTIARDLSERVRAEQQLLASEERLRQSQKMEAIGRLAGGIAHDFNNLLTVITGYSALLLEHHPPDDPDYTAIDETYKASARAADLTRQLLAFSRKQVLTLTSIDVNAVVQSLEKMLRPLIGEHIEVFTTLAPDLGSVRADRGQLEQVIVNLCVNARDAMPDGGRLMLNTTNVSLTDHDALANPELVPGDYVLLAVGDTGSGILPEIKEHIFEPFFSTKGSSGGTGLGLATVYGIVRQSGGCIDVVSAPGQGSTFNVYLPRDGALPESLSRDPGAMTIRGNEVLLLVEDEASVRGIARVALQRCGYKVLEAAGAVEAQRLAAGHAGRIDLLVTDIVMPQMNGRELADLLLRTRPETKVLYVSGYTDDAMLRHGVLGADVEFLQKPFTPESLAQKVRSVLDATPRA